MARTFRDILEINDNKGEYKKVPELKRASERMKAARIKEPGTPAMKAADTGGVANSNKKKC